MKVFDVFATVLSEATGYPPKRFAKRFVKYAAITGQLPTMHRANKHLSEAEADELMNHLRNDLPSFLKWATDGKLLSQDEVARALKKRRN